VTVAGWFVGRERELAVFDSLLASESTVRVLVFWGAPGVGKSTLLRQLATRAVGWRSHILDLEGQDLTSLDAQDSAVSADRLLFGLARMLTSNAEDERATRVRRHRGLRKFEEQAAKAGREILGGASKIRVSQFATFGGRVRQSQVHVHTTARSQTEARLAYRRSVVRALTELISHQDLSRSLLLVDTAELLRLFDEVGTERARLGAETSLGLTQWFLRELIPDGTADRPGGARAVRSRRALAPSYRDYRVDVR
jgi:hypothetical protein